MGEGWHNYHHVFPWDYKAAELGHYFNVTTFWIQLFAKIGWAYDLKEPSKDLVRRTIEKCGMYIHHHRYFHIHFNIIIILVIYVDTITPYIWAMDNLNMGNQSVDGNFFFLSAWALA